MLGIVYNYISRKCLRRKYLTLFCAFALMLCGLNTLGRAQSTSDSQKLFSPSVGQSLHEIAYELASAAEANETAADLAFILMTSTTKLDGSAAYAIPDLIKLAAKNPNQDHSQFVYEMLNDYVDRSVDLDVANSAIAYLLDHLNSREERERLLQDLLAGIGQKNDLLTSDLATTLGLLMAEKPELEAAQFYLITAVNKNPYNPIAFRKLTELIPEQIKPAVYLEQLRLMLGQNPMDIQAAIDFAQYAERLELHQTAADAYRYAADLFDYLYPEKPLPPDIYLPWALNSYNTGRNQFACLKIAARIRNEGQFDIHLEAIAVKAAFTIGDNRLTARIIEQAQEKALNLIAKAAVESDSSTKPQVTPQQLAWFYAFAAQEPLYALEWANKAYSTEPNSPTAAAILAYSLVINDQNQWAKPLLDNYQPDQVADLTLAIIRLTEQKKDAAIELLKAAIEKDPGSLVADRAKQLLAEQGSEYIPPIDGDVVLTMLRSSMPSPSVEIVPEFVVPEKIFSVQLNTRGNEFSYAGDFGGSLTITNKHSEPLVISDTGIFAGYIRVDAHVTGDIDLQIPNLVSLKIRPAAPIEPGASLIVPLRLVTGQLRQILFTFPQASLDIELTLLVDPVTADDGAAVDRFTSEQPHTLLVKRPAVKLTGRFLRNRFSSLSKGRQGQKINTARLFTGLLAEQNAMANREPFYKFMYADWMPALLKSAVVHNLTDDEWIVRAHALAGLASMPLDYELIDAVSKNLDHTHWPVRLIAVYLLAKSQGDDFKKVLDWVAKYDTDENVRQIAVALGGEEPPPPPESKTAQYETKYENTTTIP